MTALVLAALAAVSFPVTTDAASQALFDRGLLEYYAYDGADAVSSFASAAASEPALAMAFWEKRSPTAPTSIRR